MIIILVIEYSNLQKVIKFEIFQLFTKTCIHIQSYTQRDMYIQPTNQPITSQQFLTPYIQWLHHK